MLEPVAIDFYSIKEYYGGQWLFDYQQTFFKISSFVFNRRTHRGLEQLEDE